VKPSPGTKEGLRYRAFNTVLKTEFLSIGFGAPVGISIPKDHPTGAYSLSSNSELNTSRVSFRGLDG